MADTHVLIISDRNGKTLARVPVSRGYRIQEIALPKEAIERAKTEKRVEAGDSGAGVDRPK